MASLSSLAPEILAHIAHFCDEPSQLAGMARTSRKLHDIFNPKLWSTAVKMKHPGITVLAAAEGQLATLKVAAAYSADLNRAYYVPSGRRPNDWPFDYVAHGHTDQKRPWGTPLHLAARNGHTDVVQWLLGQQIDIDSPGYLCKCAPFFGMFYEEYVRAWTPLHLAICSRQPDVTQVLLHAGASFEALSESSLIPKLGQDPFQNMRYEHQSLTDVIHTAASVGDAALMTTLVEGYGIDIDKQDGHGATPLHHAIKADEPIGVAQALSLGADASRRASLHQGSLNAVDFAFAYDKSKAAAEIVTHEAVAWFIVPEGYIDGPESRTNPLQESILKCLLTGLDYASTDRLRSPSYDRSRITAITQHFQQLLKVTCEAYHKCPEGKEPIETELGTIFLYLCRSHEFGARELYALMSIGKVDLGIRVDSSQQSLGLRRTASSSRSLPYTLGSLALRAAVGTIPLNKPGAMLEVVRWLLMHGADPSPISGEEDETRCSGPMGYLLVRIFADLEEGMHVKDVFALVPVINALAGSGAWSPTCDDHTLYPACLYNRPYNGFSNGYNLLLAYRRVARHCASFSADMAAQFHREVQVAMPPDLKKLTALDFDGIRLGDH